MWTTQVGNYSLPSFPVRYLEKWDIMISRSNHGRKDSNFYILGPTLSQGYLLTAPSTGGKSKKIFQFDIYNCCGTNRFKAPKEIKANDTSFLVKLQGGNWIYYNEPKDSIAFFIKDSLDFYLITHFKENGDSIHYFSPKKAIPCPREYECSS